MESGVQDFLAADTRTTEEGNDNYVQLEPFVTGVYNESEVFGKRRWWHRPPCLYRSGHGRFIRIISKWVINDVHGKYRFVEKVTFRCALA